MAHSNVRKTLELPILPKRLFAVVPVTAEADCASVRYLEALERDGASLAFSVPSAQVARFRDEIARINAETLALGIILSPKKQKERWLPMKEALKEKVEQAKAGSKVTLEKIAC
jgi:hypothetical protein